MPLINDLMKGYNTRLAVLSPLEEEHSLFKVIKVKTLTQADVLFYNLEKIEEKFGIKQYYSITRQKYFLISGEDIIDRSTCPMTPMDYPMSNAYFDDFDDYIKYIKKECLQKWDLEQQEN